MASHDHERVHFHKYGRQITLSDVLDRIAANPPIRDLTYPTQWAGLVRNFQIFEEPYRKLHAPFQTQAQESPS